MTTIIEKKKHLISKPRKLQIGDAIIGDKEPVFIIAEIGINHNGDMGTAKVLIDAAVQAGCNAVKFQKRSPDICVPQQQKALLRDTPWGRMTYIDYRHRIEFGYKEYKELDRYCSKKQITWFASCWDTDSVEFMEQFNPPCYKIASACLTDNTLLQRIKDTRKPVILSTGMSTMDEIRRSVSFLCNRDLLVAHTTSSYQFNPCEINLKVLNTFRNEFKCPIGYSGHEIGYASTLAAVAIGAVSIERHITLDHNMWGSDHKISLDTNQLNQMVKDIRVVEKAMGDGIKQIYDSERAVSRKLRNCISASGGRNP